MSSRKKGAAPTPPVKKVVYIGQAEKDLKAMPDEVKEQMLRSIEVAKLGGTAANAELRPNMGKGVYQISIDHDTDTYRGVYLVEVRTYLVVLHAFKKKSKSGKATPKPEIDLIKRRIKFAKQHLKGTRR
jgi:phage-related protein